MALTLDGTKGETFPTWTTAGRPASPNTGQTGFNTTLSALEYYDGTNWKQNYITSGTAQNSTSGTSIDFTGIPAGVKRITVMFNGVSTSGTSNYQIQIGSGGTPVTTSSYSGYVQRGGAAGTAYTAFTTGFLLTDTMAATYLNVGQCVITNITGNTWVMSGTCFSTTAVNTGNYYSGFIALSGTLNIVRFTTVNGTDTFDAGSINIMYE